MATAPLQQGFTAPQPSLPSVGMASSASEAAATMPSGSFSLLAQIANSVKLSSLEKTGLIQTVYIVDTLKAPQLRQKLLGDLARTALFMERTARHTYPKHTVDSAVATYQATHAPAGKSPQEAVQDLPRTFRGKSLSDIPQLEKPTEADPFSRTESAKDVVEIRLPGSGQAEDAPPPPPLPLPGAEAATSTPVEADPKVAQLPELKLPGAKEPATTPTPSAEALLAPRIVLYA